MKDFGLIDFASGTFPSAVAVNSSGPTVKDGTVLKADWVNELWGSFQALLAAADVTPSGSVESSTASDVLNSIRKISGSPGEILFWGGRDADPVTHENRLILLAGQVVSIASYPDLVAAVYCGDANNGTAEAFYKTSDAGGTTPDIAGTYLVLPDCRGYFVRGLNGTTATVDTGRIADGTEAEPGSAQSYQAGLHDHYTGWWTGIQTNTIENTAYWVYPADPGGSAVEDNFLTPRASAINPPSVVGDGRTYNGGYDVTGTDEETRPRNIAFHCMIRY